MSSDAVVKRDINEDRWPNMIKGGLKNEVCVDNVYRGQRMRYQTLFAIVYEFSLISLNDNNSILLQR